MKKHYVVHVSVLLDNPKAVTVLRNGEENDITIMRHTLDALDKMQKNPRIAHIVKEIIDELDSHSEHITIYDCKLNELWACKEFYGSHKHLGCVIVVNDRLFGFQLKNAGIQVENFREALPYQSETQLFTGFLEEGERYIPNAFFWREGKLHRSLGTEESQVKLVDYDNEIWKIKPRNPTQNAAMELLLDPNLDVVSMQGCSGFGKTQLAIAAALHWVLEKKRFEKIIVVKHNLEVGEAPLGFLPGDVMAKVSPYFKPVTDLLLKMHRIRPCSRLFMDAKSPTLEFDPKVLQLTPIQFLRGQNIDNAFVLIDEAQNLSRQEVKVVLSRMGDNVRCVLTGDVQQIDAVYLNEFNNGLNWVTKMFKGQPNYGHVVLKSNKSRGPIADLVRNTGL